MKFPASKNFWIILLLFIFVMTFAAKYVRAQLNSQSITMTPPAIKVSLNSGDTTEGTLGLINDSDGNLSFVVRVYDFVVNDNQGTPQILPQGTLTNNKYSASSWVAVAPDTFTVKAHERFNFNYYIKVPNQAAPGGHYAAIVYQPINPNAESGSGARIQTQLATLVYLTVNGPVNEYAKVTKFTAPSFQEFGPIEIQTEIKNYGDIHMSPQGIISIKDMFGRTLETTYLQNRNIFPGNVALLYKNTLGSTWMFGRFTAKFVGSYGTNNNLPLIGTLSFWVFPWRAALVIIFIITAAVLGFLLWKKKKIKKETIPSSQPEAPQQQVKI